MKIARSFNNIEIKIGGWLATEDEETCTRNICLNNYIYKRLKECFYINLMRLKTRK